MPETYITTEDDAALWWETTGDGPPLILCHGGPGYWDTLAPLAAMVDDGYTVVRWDQRGCGRSARSEGPFTLAQAIADLDAVRRHAGVERFVLGGHSWGASLALHYALAYPSRVERLLYLCGTGIEWAHGPGQAYAAERLARLGNTAARVEALAGRVRSAEEEIELGRLLDATNYADRDHAAALAEAHYDHRFPVNVQANRSLHGEATAIETTTMAARCAALDLPVLVLQGAGDPRPAFACDSLVAALPRARRVTVPGGHEPWIEAPRETREALRSFLGLPA